MIRTSAQRSLRLTLQRLPRGPRQAVFELMREGMPADQAIIVAGGVWFVLQDIAFAPSLHAAGRVH